MDFILNQEVLTSASLHERDITVSGSGSGDSDAVTDAFDVNRSPKLLYYLQYTGVGVTPAESTGFTQHTATVAAYEAQLILARERIADLERKVVSLESSAFNALARWWYATASSLSPSEKYEHEAYQEIVSQGRDFIPHLLRDLRDSDGDWFEALAEITQEWPVDEGDEGFFEKMKAAWLRWGRENSYSV